MSAKLTCIIEMHAGGGWEGHVFFLVKHPLSGEIIARTNFIKQVESACEEHGLVFDESIKQVIKEKLVEDPQYGVLVPKEHLNKHLIVTSAQEYLNKIQKEYF